MPCHAQRTAGGLPHYVTGQFALRPEPYPHPSRVQVSARQDGLVEFLLESVPAFRFAIPWLVTQAMQTLPEPSRTRVAVSPDSARRMAARLDSVLSYRVSGSARSITLLRLDSIPNSYSMLYVFTHEIFTVNPPQRDTTASVTFSGCIQWPEAPLAQRAASFHGRTDISEIRRLSAAIWSAAELAGSLQPSRSDAPKLLTSADAGCPARPVQGNPVPAYPSSLWARLGTQRVHLDAIVDTAGRLASVSMAFGDTTLGSVARATLRTWRFHPAVRTSGQVAPQRIHIEVWFGEEEPRTEAQQNALLESAAAHGADILVIAAPPSLGRPAQ